MIKIVIILMLLFSYKSSAGTTPYLSFINLITSPESYNSKRVKLSGYFLNTDEGAYLCMTMETCYTRGKERVRVRGVSELNIKKANRCHIQLSGNFISLVLKDQSHWPLSGYLDVSDDYSISYNDGYEIINEKCEIYNEYSKYKYGK